MAKKALTMDGAVKRKSVPQRGGEKAVSLTLRLTQAEYERLAIYGIKNRATHQKILHEALLKHLDDLGA